MKSQKEICKKIRSERCPAGFYPTIRWAVRMNAISHTGAKIANPVIDRNRKYAQH